MTDYTAYFNPEIEAILQDIARDPKAKLLKVPSSGELVYAMREVRVGIAAPSLTSAEQKLLEVYRDEVGELLKQRCLIEFFKQPDADLRWHRSVRAGEVLKLRDQTEWRVEAQSVLDRGIHDPRTTVGEDTLRACIAKDSTRPPSILQLATAMRRVVELEQAGIYIAMDLLAKSMLPEVHETCQSVLSGRPAPLYEAVAHETMGVAHSLSGDSPEAMEAFNASFDSFEGRSAAAMNGFCLAIEIGDINSAQSFAARLDHSLSPDDEGIQSFVAGSRWRARTAMLVLPESSSALLHRLKSLKGTATSKVCEAFDA